MQVGRSDGRGRRTGAASASPLNFVQLHAKDAPNNICQLLNWFLPIPKAEVVKFPYSRGGRTRSARERRAAHRPGQSQGLKIFRRLPGFFATAWQNRERRRAVLATILRRCWPEKIFCLLNFCAAQFSKGHLLSCRRLYKNSEPIHCFLVLDKNFHSTGAGRV